jgi:glycosyltransferase involved in cell wall biosynthesis
MTGIPGGKASEALAADHQKLEASLVRELNAAVSLPNLLVLVLGAQQYVTEVAVLIKGVGQEAAHRDAQDHLARINREVLAHLGGAAEPSLVSAYDLADFADVLPYDDASAALGKAHAYSPTVVFADAGTDLVVPFWQEVATRNGLEAAAVLISFTPPAGGGAGQLIAWLRQMLAAERSTRGLSRIVVQPGIGEDLGSSVAKWMASTWDFPVDLLDGRFGAASNRTPAGSSRPAAADALAPGFNSWVRRCEAAFAQLAKQGESEFAYRELDRIQVSLDAAMAMFVPLLNENRKAIEQLQAQNARLEKDAEKQGQPSVIIDHDWEAMIAQVEFLKTQEQERQAELAATRNEMTGLRAWCDDTGAQKSRAQAELLDTRLKLGRSVTATERMSRALANEGERQLRSAGKPLASILKRRRWGFKAAQRLERHIGIVENFLDDLPWPLIGVHPEGRRQRIIAYLRGASDFLADFPLVQDLEYSQMYPDVPPSGMKPLVHFILHGQSELRNPHPLFDTLYYIEQCPESVPLASSPAVHYIKWGKDKGHDPHPLFSTQGYLQRYPDVAPRNPLVHWIEYFRNTVDVLFDPQFYFDSYPDVADAGRNPLTHYLTIGWREGRNPNPWFDTGYYLAAHPTLMREGINPLVHYVREGWRLRARPGPQFDPAFYLENDPGLTADSDPLRHFIEHGRAEGRSTVSNEPLPVEEHAVESIEPAALRVPHQTVRPALPARAGRVALMVEALYPRPDLDSGSLDHVNFARIFQRMGYEVHYLSLLEFGRDHDERTPHYRALLEAMGVHCVTAEHNAYFEGYYFDLSDRVDLCFVSRVHFGGGQIESLRRLCPDARIIFNTVDLHFVREEREGALKNDPALMLRARRTRDTELDFATIADATLVVSSSEKVLLDELAPEARTHVVPLIREFAEQRAGTFADRRDIAFVGGFNHQPNIDAIEHFLADVWPHVQRRRPDIGFRVIGANMPDEWARRKVPGVVFVGFVEDLDSELARLRMTVAPLRYGAGAKGKLVSSLAAGVPAVVSAIASEGMGLVDGETVLVADGGEAFADQIIRLYDDEALWQHLSINGSAFIRHYYSIDMGFAIMRAVLAEVGVAPPFEAESAHVTSQAGRSEDLIKNAG